MKMKLHNLQEINTVESNAKVKQLCQSGRNIVTVTQTAVTNTDVVIVNALSIKLIKRLNKWKENVESKGMRVNMNKTKVQAASANV